MEKTLKILSVGNSFSVDTMQHCWQIARAMGYESVTLGNLFIGGCSIRRHHENAIQDAPAYKYYLNTDGVWQETPDVSIRTAVESAPWDWISIQHGTKDGSRYTAEESYDKLPALVEYLQGLAQMGTRIAFNMTWVGEMDYPHPEIQSYHGDQLRMYRNITDITQRVVLAVPGIARVSPTGTAVQNARTSKSIVSLSRDGYHLSLGLGRYLAGLTFLQALTGERADMLDWVPDGVSDTEKQLALESAANALKMPFAVTTSAI